MQIETLGHATLLLTDDAGAPILATDPWLVGSCYWRSWWLERYPSESEIARLAGVRWIYITHEHPDHLHPPSLRRLGKRPEILLPDFKHCRMHDYLAENGWTVRRLKPRSWETLAPGVAVMSLPMWNNDSILLVDTPTALIVNLNDAKPTRIELRRICELKQRIGKTCVLLRSYSPAAPTNSYFVDGKRMAAGKNGYISAVQRACTTLNADDFIPFASQVEFHRPDTEWANRYKVRYEDLAAAWRCRTRLNPPYSKIDLESGRSLRSDPAAAQQNRAIAARVEAQSRADAQAVWNPDDRVLLEKRFRAIRLPLRLLFPLGFTIATGAVALAWDSPRGRIVTRPEPGQFRLTVPLLALKEALHNGHLGDLCIPMFARIDLFGGTPRDRVNWFFMLLVLQDYGYVGNLRRTLAWLGWALWGGIAMRIPLQRPQTPAQPPAPSVSL